MPIVANSEAGERGERTGAVYVVTSYGTPIRLVQVTRTSPTVSPQERAWATDAQP